MRIKYLEDTDTALAELSDRPPVETRELSENIYLDLDSEGNIVGITIEHASAYTAMREFLYQIIPAAASV